MDLCIIGLNHRTTPLEVRERFSVPPERVPALLAALKTQGGLDEAVVLSTCNRFEVYAASANGSISLERILQTMASIQGEGNELTDWTQIHSYVYQHAHTECVRHLFRVTSSLDSLIVGETEIVGQVKKAYQLAQAAGATGKTLNRLFQRALAVSKEVRTRSGIGRCSTSAGSVALDLAMKIFGEDLSQKTILIVGAGKIGETTLKHLAKHGARSILVTNRSFERAQELVSKFDGKALPFAQLPEALVQADIVVSSTSAPHYVLTQDLLARTMGKRSDRALLLIDLAVPRDIDPAAHGLPSVYLYNIDQLAELARLNLERRQSEAAACEDLVANHARAAAGALVGDDTAGRSRRVKAASQELVGSLPAARAGVLGHLEPVEFRFA